MLFMHLPFIVLTGALLVVIFRLALRARDYPADRVPLFVSIFLGAWVVGLSVTPDSPFVWSICWVPILFVCLAAVMLLVFSPASETRSHHEAVRRAVERRHMKTLAGMLVVLTLGVLVVAAIAQYGLKM
jgi:hypothetical protein